MEVFLHHIYEYEKGIRNLILHTISKKYMGLIERKLESHGISYHISELKNGNINVFFGDESCIQVIKTINKDSLTDYTLEEDFMLGIMLGYDRKKQCERYLKFKELRKEKVS
ncbi:MAG: DUF2023 family protein [Cetobacterium sp.]|uniref:DUF2023 family protein n=1 Tax=Cetobacterium sp. TaxID=2071632 RepID=UPI003F2ECA3F